jgi:hypothetical protein
MWQSRSVPKVQIVLPESSVTVELVMVARSEGEAEGRAVWRGTRDTAVDVGRAAKELHEIPKVHAGICDAVVVTVIKAGGVGISVSCMSTLPSKTGKESPRTIPLRRR